MDHVSNPIAHCNDGPVSHYTFSLNHVNSTRSYCFAQVTGDDWMLLTWLATAQVSGPESIQDDPKCIEEIVLRDMMPEKRGHILRWTCRHDPWSWLFRTLFLFFPQKGLPSKSWVILCFLWGGIRLNIPRPAEKVFASLARRRSFESSFAIHSKPTFTRVCDFLNCCHECCSRFNVLCLNGATNSRAEWWARLLNENIMPTYEQLSTLLQLSSFKPPFPTCVHSGFQRYLLIFCMSLVFGLTSPLLPSIGSLASWQVRGPNLEWHAVWVAWVTYSEADLRSSLSMKCFFG